MDISPRLGDELREQRRRFLTIVCAVAALTSSAALVPELSSESIAVSTLLARGLIAVVMGSYGVLLHRRLVDQENAELGLLLVVAAVGFADLLGRFPALDSGEQGLATWINAWLAYVVPLQIGSYLAWSSRLSPGRRNVMGLLVAYALLSAAVARAPADGLDLAAALVVPVASLVMLHAMHRMIALLAQHEALARADARDGRTDHLTGVLNRRGVLPRLAELRPGDGVLLLDIDHFKGVNDRHGHETGDRVLHQVAQLLTQVVREQDVVARWGGEEFLVVTAATPPAAAEDATDQRGSAGRASAEARIAERVRAAVDGGPTMVPTTVSVGLALMRPADADWQDVVRRADVHLYEAKRRGRNRVVAEG